MIGTHRVLVADADISCWVDEVTIQHGRDDTTTQPEASSATIELSWDLDYDDPLPSVVEVGAAVDVYTDLDGTTYPRFSGAITDAAYGWDDTGTDTPDTPTAQLVAVGPLADLGRRVVGDTPFPQENDGTRVTRILDLAAAPTDPFLLDPGTVQILPRDIDSQAALDVASSTAESARGIIWQTRDGRVGYADAEHRRNIPVSLALDACDVLVTPTWSRDLSGLINKVSIGYGPTPDEGEQPRYLAQRDDSIGKYGTYDYSFSTELAELADALAMGQLLLTRNVTPAWEMPTLPIDVAGLDATQTAALLGLEMHQLVNLTGLPAVAAAPTSALLWVEGWTERLAYDTHEIELAVSGYCRTVPAPRWDDVDPAYSWDTIQPPSLTWDGASCLGPLVDLARWDDVSASLRWDLVPAAVTWDTWNDYEGGS
jgi:hypothetical protein